MRLGFSVRVYGAGELPSHDARPWHQGPHLSVSLAYLRDILVYLRANRIHMYRMHSELTPHVPQPEWSDFAGQMKECARQLAAIGDLARDGEIRLSFHPYSAVVLNALNEDQLARSLLRLRSQAALLDAMSLGPEAGIVLHVGGVYDDLATSRERFVRRYEALPQSVRRRVVLENDDHRFSFSDVRIIQETCGVPLVLDNLHHLVFNPDKIALREALDYAISTWPDGVTPKVHFATPRTEMRRLAGSSRLKVPTWTEHADFVNPFEFIAFMELAEGARDFDIMLETKARDVALLKLRQDLERFAPEMAGRVH